LALDHPDVEEVAARLRAADLPVIARIAGGQLLIDPRTVRPGQEDDLLAALVRWLTPAPPAAGKISA